MENIQKISISEQVYIQLRDRILKKVLPVGTELPSERELSETLGVNRGAVREAIKRLQQARLVRVRHGGATQVENFEAEGGLELLPSLMVSAQGQVNLEVARGIVALRKALAPVVAGQAAVHGGKALADALKPVIANMQNTSELPKLQQLAFDFWALVVQGSGNVVFKLAFNSMNQTYLAAWNTLTLVMQDEFRDVNTLVQLAQAIEAGEQRRCEVLARQHVELGSRALNAALGTA
ncbi:MAG: FadR family transcriptional regulator [Limnobacter sp.]|jgi:GntR family transcriptional regulator, transcriptional repressor for pyruvate dehydrogenase complex|uniref:FadR/GntR family transcriptional regulator n=1 Tax=Limnobacter sp. TaxID=2003368 RepID=UPI00121660F1|nr:GntR family transcriptional regulator [Limnobacter sp.]MDZ4049111.1 GntR family transcriptional regulator [Limnobacter sp.]RZO93495.1 MAG: FadR family transcriptional regulator [Limnobacter sp.]